MRMAVSASPCPISTPTLKLRMLATRPFGASAKSCSFVARPKPWNRPNISTARSVSEKCEHAANAACIPGSLLPLVFFMALVACFIDRAAGRQNPVGALALGGLQGQRRGLDELPRHLRPVSIVHGAAA